MTYTNSPEHEKWSSRGNLSLLLETIYSRPKFVPRLLIFYDRVHSSVIQSTAPFVKGNKTKLLTEVLRGSLKTLNEASTKAAAKLLG